MSFLDFFVFQTHSLGYPFGLLPLPTLTPHGDPIMSSVYIDIKCSYGELQEATLNTHHTPLDEQSVFSSLVWQLSSSCTLRRHTCPLSICTVHQLPPRYNLDLSVPCWSAWRGERDFQRPSGRTVWKKLVLNNKSNFCVCCIQRVNGPIGSSRARTGVSKSSFDEIFSWMNQTVFFPMTD